MDFWQRGLGARLKPKYVHTSCHHQNMRQKALTIFGAMFETCQNPVCAKPLGPRLRKPKKFCDSHCRWTHGCWAGLRNSSSHSIHKNCGSCFVLQPKITTIAEPQARSSAGISDERAGENHRIYAGGTRIPARASGRAWCDTSFSGNQNRNGHVPDDRLVRAEEAAQFLSYSKDWIYRH